MENFDPNISAQDYAALSTQEQRLWDVGLLDHWAGNYNRQCVDDFMSDRWVIHEEEWGGQTSTKQAGK